MRLWSRLFVFLLLVSAPVTAALAQDCVEVTYPTILECQDGSGCRHTGGSGVLTPRDIEFVLDEADPYGNGVLICDAQTGCQWAAISETDAHLVYGGSGEVGGQKAMTFTEAEAEGGFVFCEDEAEDGFVFDEDEVSALSVVPLSGQWTAFHAAGVFTCPGVLTLEIPAGDIQDATIAVAEDGNSFHATDLSPDTADMTMRRTGPGTYRAELEINAPEGVMTIQYDVAFASEDMAMGMISGEMQSQGFACSVERGVWIVHESATSDVEPVDDAGEGVS